MSAQNFHLPGAAQKTEPRTANRNASVTIARIEKEGGEAA